MPKYLNSIDSDLSQPKNIKAIFKDLQPETYKMLQPLDVQKMLGARSLGQKVLAVNEWSEENNIITFTNDNKFYYSVNPITRKLQKCEVPKDLFMYINAPNNKMIVNGFPFVYFHKSYEYSTGKEIHPAILDNLALNCVNKLSDDINTFTVRALWSALDLREDQTTIVVQPHVGHIAYGIVKTGSQIAAKNSLMRKVIINPIDLHLIKDKHYIDEATTREILTTGLYGHVDTADIHVSSGVPKGNALILGGMEDVGDYVISKTDVNGNPMSLMMGQSINLCLRNIELIRSISWKEEDDA